LEKPEIAIAVILENGGWGAYAAPLAREMTDFYMLHVKPQQFSDGDEPPAVGQGLSASVRRQIGKCW
jgi:hypothetical protein